MALLYNQYGSHIVCSACGKVIGNAKLYKVERGMKIEVKPHYCIGGKGICRMLRKILGRN